MLSFGFVTKTNYRHLPECKIHDGLCLKNDNDRQIDKMNTGLLAVSVKNSTAVIFNSYYPDMGEWTSGEAYTAQGRSHMMCCIFILKLIHIDSLYLVLERLKAKQRLTVVYVHLHTTDWAEWMICEFVNINNK